MGFKACFLCGIELDAEFDPKNFSVGILKRKRYLVHLKMKRGFQYV